ncbi:hypothetical protein [Cesiribacter sp. SM1]|uniref:hypothetical protein n=1 Tax=Cesiribacter sp. SM1 TaxID=2861196 RepID=UPI001CD6BDE2|nr:hypothetical protein [Cesiribacter sp. SM1]
MGYSLQAQDAPAGSNNSLSRQFQNMKEGANNYQEYKVVRERNLDEFWKNVQDTLAARQRQMLESRQQIQDQQQEIKRLSQEINERNQEVAESEYEKAHIQVLGMNIQKEAYVTFNWVVIGLLILILAVVLYNHRNSKRFAVRKRSEFEMLEQEFQDFKNRSRERETKLMRELQTERNAVEELNQQLVAAQRGKPGA